jgi:putative ABC transport system substrate-binding protein
MDRRAFIVALLATSACGREEPAKPVAGPRIPRVTLLYFGAYTPTPAAPHPRSSVAFRQRIAELGYVDGKTILIEERFAGGDPQRLAALAAELAASGVDAVVASGSSATAAMKQATTVIPIVMAGTGNAIGSGVVDSLVQPGGNVTGTVTLPLGGKLVDLGRELVPGLARLAILVNPASALAESFVATATEAAERYAIAVTVTRVSRTEDFAPAFAAIRGARPQALLVGGDPFISAHGASVYEFAAATRLPVVYDLGVMVRQGGLIAYATDLPALHALAADYVDKILKGAKPTDLPVQQPTRFELVINLPAAKAIGLAIPQPVLLRADEVIKQ